MPLTPAASGRPVARIDLAALAHNYSEVLRIVGDGVDVIAMVKTNAYGHGVERIGLHLAQAGCRAFGVATLAEAAALRAALSQVGDACRVIVFGALLPGDAAAAVEVGAEVVTENPEVVCALGGVASAQGTEVALHIKVDTGMTRLGVAPDGVRGFARHVAATAGVRAVALCSHFAQAECVTGDVTRGQVASLRACREALAREGADLPCHIANSAGILTRDDARFAAVRPGLMLYGLYPDAALRDRAGLRPVMTLTAPVVRVAEVEAGRGVSYGHTFVTSRRTRVATLRCGYGDGYPRVLSNRGRAHVDGKEVPVIGRVCMDHTMIDVSDVPSVAVGDRAVLWGGAVDAAALAALADTIAYELVARVGARVVREYV